MILLLWLAGVADLSLTAWGIHIDIVPEANPVLAWAYDHSLIGTVIAVSIITGAAFWILHLARERVRWLRPMLFVILAVRVVVMGLHAVWVAAVI